MVIRAVKPAAILIRAAAVIHPYSTAATPPRYVHTNAAAVAATVPPRPAFLRTPVSSNILLFLLPFSFSCGLCPDSFLYSVCSTSVSAIMATTVITPMIPPSTWLFFFLESLSGRVYPL